MSPRDDAPRQRPRDLDSRGRAYPDDDYRGDERVGDRYDDRGHDDRYRDGRGYDDRYDDRPRDDRYDDETSGPPYRAIAMVLLAAVVVAAGVGIAQLFGGGGDDTATADRAETSEVAPAEGDAGQPADGQPAEGQPGAGDPAAEGQPGDGLPAEGQPAPEGDPQAPGAEGQPAPEGDPAAPAPGAAPAEAPAPTAVPVRVLNNSTVSGLAARTGDELRSAGFRVADVANIPSNQGVVSRSVAYYGDGPGEREAAEAVAQQLGIQAEPRPQGFGDGARGVLVIVTQDLNR